MLIRFNKLVLILSLQHVYHPLILLLCFHIQFMFQHGRETCDKYSQIYAQCMRKENIRSHSALAST
jgi:hypothetical protein